MAGGGFPGSGRGDSALGNGYGGRVPREGLNGDFFVAAAAMDAAMSKLQSMPLQRCNGVCCNGGRGCRPAFSSRSRHLSCGRERERERERVESMFPFDL